MDSPLIDMFVFYRTGVRRKREDGGGALREGNQSGVALFLKGVCL